MPPDVSDKPIVAPADWETRAPRHEVEDLSEVRDGGSWPTTLACFACGNAEGNVAVFHSWWCSRNGDARSNDEIRCAKCRKYTLYITEH